MVHHVTEYHHQLHATRVRSVMWWCAGVQQPNHRERSVFFITGMRITSQLVLYQYHHQYSVINWG